MGMKSEVSHKTTLYGAMEKEKSHVVILDSELG
jgi:hypothetical protein